MTGNGMNGQGVFEPKIWLSLLAIAATSAGVWYIFGRQTRNPLTTTATPQATESADTFTRALTLGDTSSPAPFIWGEALAMLRAVPLLQSEPTLPPNISRPPARSTLSQTARDGDGMSFWIGSNSPTSAEGDSLSQSLRTPAATPADDLSQAIASAAPPNGQADPLPVFADPALSRRSAGRLKGFSWSGQVGASGSIGSPPSEASPPTIAAIPETLPPTELPATQPLSPAAQQSPGQPAPAVAYQDAFPQTYTAPASGQSVATNPSQAADFTAQAQAMTFRDRELLSPSQTEADLPADPTLQPLQQPLDTEFAALDSPLIARHPMMPTAHHLRQGEVAVNFRNRLFFLEDSVEESGTAAYPNFGITWGITDSLELDLALQFVDSGSPGRQGDFFVTRDPNTDVALSLKQRLWQNASETQALSALASFSFGSRGFQFGGARAVEGERDSIIPALQLPFTTTTADRRLQFTLSPTVAFFPDSNAVHLHRPPIDDPGSFGTTFGFGGAVSYQINPRFSLWGDVFAPITGNNSISRDSGRPAKALAYNAGLRYLLNPKVAIDLYASNTLGSTGPLALTADRDLTAFGVSVSFMPDAVPNNRRYPNHFGSGEAPPRSPMTTDGLAFFDGGIVPRDRGALEIQGGNQGVLTALRYGAAQDLEVSLYMDYVLGTTDESEQGIGGKLRLLNQAAGDPFTLSLAATGGLTNEPFVNFFNNDRDEFDRRNLDKNVPFLLAGDDDREGRLFVTTLSLPMQYQFESGAAVWLTPTWGFVQRRGTEIAGFNLGGAVPLSRDFSLIGEIGANFAGEGNAFIGDTLANVIPWAAALRWDPSHAFGIDPKPNQSRPYLQLYVTNRAGSSPFQSLRVRSQDSLAIGVGVSLPF